MESILSNEAFGDFLWSAFNGAPWSDGYFTLFGQKYPARRTNA